MSSGIGLTFVSTFQIEPPRDVRRVHFLGGLESWQVVRRGGIRRSCVSGPCVWSPRSAFSRISPHFRPRRHLLSANGGATRWPTASPSGTRSPGLPRPPSERELGQGFPPEPTHNARTISPPISLTVPSGNR